MNEHGNTPLHYACFWNFAELAQVQAVICLCFLICCKPTPWPSLWFVCMFLCIGMNARAAGTQAHMHANKEMVIMRTRRHVANECRALLACLLPEQQQQQQRQNFLLPSASLLPFTHGYHTHTMCFRERSQCSRQWSSLVTPCCVELLLVIHEWLHE